ncbi:MAG TPA: hypothetical protein VMC80_03460 [Patescibacteria group bacterium]|nr:hypothetical protein [Patescibacteria group bacterium]
MEESEKNLEEERKKAEEEQIKREKKTFISFFILIGIIVFAFAATWFLINASKHFVYKGVDFYVDQTTAKGMTLFRATLVGEVTKDKYNFYFRNEPSKLESIPINGTLIFRKNIVFDSSINNFTCDGNGPLATYQFANGMTSLYSNSGGIKLMMQNSSVQYTPPENYMFFHFVQGNVTEINQLDGFNNYYTVVVNNCEILPAMERIMLEAIVKAKGA